MLLVHSLARLLDSLVNLILPTVIKVLFSTVSLSPSWVRVDFVVFLIGSGLFIPSQRFVRPFIPEDLLDVS